MQRSKFYLQVKNENIQKIFLIFYILYIKFTSHIIQLLHIYLHLN